MYDSKTDITFRLKIPFEIISIKKRQESQKVVFKNSFWLVLALNILTNDQRYFL